MSDPPTRADSWADVPSHSGARLSSRATFVAWRTPCANSQTERFNSEVRKLTSSMFCSAAMAHARRRVLSRSVLSTYRHIELRHIENTFE